MVDAKCAPKAIPMAKNSVVPWFYHVLASPGDHPISRNLEPVSLEYASEIQFVNGETLAHTPILTSSTNSTRTGLAPMVSLGMPLNYGKNPQIAPDPTNEDNKLCLAGLSEGKFQSHFKNRIVDEYAKNKLSDFKEQASAEGKSTLGWKWTFYPERLRLHASPER